MNSATESALAGPRDGDTYEGAVDAVRLNRQALAVWRAMIDGRWRTLEQISALASAPQASVSARLRDFRKARFGGHTVERQRVTGGLYEYRLVPAVPLLDNIKAQGLNSQAHSAAMLAAHAATDPARGVA